MRIPRGEWWHWKGQPVTSSICISTHEASSVLPGCCGGRSASFPPQILFVLAEGPHLVLSAQRRPSEEAVLSCEGGLVPLALLELEFGRKISVQVASHCLLHLGWPVTSTGLNGGDVSKPSLSDSHPTGLSAQGFGGGQVSG